MSRDCFNIRPWPVNFVLGKLVIGTLGVYPDGSNATKSSRIRIGKQWPRSKFTSHEFLPSHECIECGDPWRGASGNFCVLQSPMVQLMPPPSGPLPRKSPLIASISLKLQLIRRLIPLYMFHKEPSIYTAPWWKRGRGVTPIISHDIINHTPVCISILLSVSPPSAPRSWSWGLRSTRRWCPCWGNFPPSPG